jgi:imidazolonepropionase-like amidohydrolase
MKFLLLTFSSFVLLCTGAFAADSNENYILLKNATIIDMVTESGRTGDLLIKQDKIFDISFKDPIKPPKGAVIYDLSGKYIIPGLIDNHVHITHSTYLDAVDEIETALKNGITGVRDMGGDGRMLAQLKRAALIGEIPASDVFFSAIIAGDDFYNNDPRPASVALGANVGNEAWQWTLNDDTDYNNIIAQTKGLGATAIKAYARLELPAFQKIVAEAKRQGLKVWAHASIPPMRPSEIIRAGADVISHAGSFIQYEIADDIKDRYDFDTREARNEYRQKLKEIPFSATTPKVKSLLETMKKNETILDATLWLYQLEGQPIDLGYALKVTKMVHEAGIKIGAGTDGLNHDDGSVSNIHLELKLLTQAGLTPLDALRAATIVNAIGLGQASQIGSIEVNKLANLVILNADPLENIDNSRSVNTVFKRGKSHEGYSSMYMLE